MTWWGDNLDVTTPEIKIRRADIEFIGAGKNLCGTFTWNHSTQHLPALLGCKSFVFHVSTIERAKLLAQTWQDVVAYRRTARPWARLYVLPHRCSRLSRRGVSSRGCRPKLGAGRPELIRSVNAQLRFAKIQGCRWGAGDFSSRNS